MSEIDREIIQQIYLALERHGASMELLAAIGSWRDTLDDDDVLEILESQNALPANSEAIKVATRCLEFDGGYSATEEHLRIFRHGVQTVIAELSKSST